MAPHVVARATSCEGCVVANAARAATTSATARGTSSSARARGDRAREPALAAGRAPDSRPSADTVDPYDCAMAPLTLSRQQSMRTRKKREGYRGED